MYVQRDDDNNIVAVYDIWVELDVKFAEATSNNTNSYYNGATINNAPDLYFGKTMPTDKDGIIPIEITIPAYSDFDKVESEDKYGANDLSSTNDPTDFTVNGEDKHATSASFKITTSERLFGDVVITLKDDPKHDSTWLKAVEPTTNNNLTVSVADATITLGGTNTTPTVGDLLLWLDAECDEVNGRYCDHATIEVYDNTEANGVVNNSTVITTANVNNLYVKVTSEKGSVKTYSIVFEAPATDGNADGTNG